MDTHNLLQETAYDYLKNKIANGSIEYGKIYSERSISSEIGISRTPFRRALTRLEHDKYIDIIPSKGFRLHQLTEPEIKNIFQMRMAIEGFCCRHLWANRASADGQKTLRTLEQSLKNMQKAIEQNEGSEQILHYDMIFHKYIVHFCENDDLINLYDLYSHQLFDIAMKSFESPNRPLQALDEHKKIFDSLNVEDPTGTPAYLSIIDHLEITEELVLSILDA